MTIEAGSTAPHFALLGTDGREYLLPQSAEGQSAVLVFFKTTCGTCDLAFPYINRLPQAYPEGWHLWAVSQDPLDASADYARRREITCPVLLDAPAYVVSRLYDPPATPTLFLVDRIGRIAFQTAGFSKQDLNELSRLLAIETGVAPAVIAPAGDGKPDFKPG